jgi:hypothetical protein
MPTKSYTLIPYHLRDHNIQSWKNLFFYPYPRGTLAFWGPKNHFLKYIWAVPLWILRYMSTKSHAHTRCGTLRKSSISTRGYDEIHIQRPLFDNKISILKILGLKIQPTETCSSASFTRRFLFILKTLKS